MMPKAILRLTRHRPIDPDKTGRQCAMHELEAIAQVGASATQA